MAMHDTGLEFLAAIRRALDELRLAKCRDDIVHTHCEVCKLRVDADRAYTGLVDLLARLGGEDSID